MNSLTLTAILTFVTPALLAQQQDKFVDVDGFIEKVEAQRNRTIEGSAKTILASLEKAIRSESMLVKTYISAYGKTNFGEGDAAEEKLELWKTQNQLKLDDPTFKKALRIHATFLISALLKSLDKDDKALDFSKRVYTLAVGTTSSPKISDYARYDEIKRPLSQSVFLGFDNRSFSMTGLRNWYTGPLTNVAEMHRVNIMGPLREAKSKTLFTEWKRNIQLEQALSKDPEQFALIRESQLKAMMAADYIALGDERKGLSMMMDALKANPMHPQFNRMMTDLKDWLSAARGEGKDEGEKQ